ncbi:LysR substrate-binding domain-containing protein [Enterobacillus tribolii]|uniref:LysR family transcriptional regulator n=1 Tax=Enterobacillus tribolii TaxID=1487935 RepID=A0A370R3A5_9GAMM|nr:LysR substrate-binding domain-containing protein [Enterobacillus tribolii]MBW7983955.1 LysR family transcriptional regulator [Enterobacillus tribolii]RDK96893.1 LysR family transcriptional regulator [Enterobacillus tribolii]
MDLRQLRYFLAVAEEKHFGRAARALNIVQPALSMQIRALEDELGGALFRRTSRSVELTEAGKLLQTEAQRTLEQAEFARHSVARALRGETGTVRIGFAGNAIFSGKLTDDLRLFRKQYPDAEMIIREVSPQQQVDAILSGQQDIGYTPDHSKTVAAGINVQRIGDWEMRVALSDTHPLAEHPHITIDMLSGEPLILYDAHDTHEQLYVMLSQKLRDKLYVAQRSDSTLSVLAAAAAGLGLALVPAPVRQVKVPGLVYRRLNAPELKANLLLISREDETNGAVNAYLALAKQSVP